MLYALLFFAIVIVDQLSKAFVEARNLDVELIDNFFSISIVRNRGAAFSAFSNESWAQIFFIVMTIIILLALSLYLILTKKKSKFFKISVVMIMGGAIGNFIDRLAFKGVRDFIYPHFFANFNVADIFICVGAFLLAVFFVFIDDGGLFSKHKGEDKTKDISDDNGKKDTKVKAKKKNKNKNQKPSSFLD